MKTKIKDYDLVVDTREQNPLPFRKCITGTLSYGDYAAKVEDDYLPVVFERKSPNDLWGTITKGHDRFKEEILRASDKGDKLIVIVECSYSDFINKKFDGSYHSNLPVHVVIKILHKLQVRYNLEFVFCNNRSEACSYIRNYFNALNEEYQSI